MKWPAILASVVLFDLACLSSSHAQFTPWKKNSTDSLFRVSQNFKEGYIDGTGKIVIPAKFDETKDFSEGLAAVRVCANYGYIDTSGRMVIEPRFESAEPFSDGLAQVRLFTNEVAYIDRTGKIAFTLQPGQTSGSFSEGLAVASSRSESGSDTRERLGFIDKAGNYAVPPRFDRSGGFSQGLASVMVGNKWGFIDRSGKYVAEPQFDEAWPFSEGRAPVKLSGKYGFIDRTGTMVVRPKFDGVDPFFSEGLIEVKVGDKWGFSDAMGNLVVPAKFDGPTDSIWFVWFSGGLAPVRVGSKWGFVDRTGKMVIEPHLDLIAPFSNGLAMATIEEKEFYIDRTGKPVRVISDTSHVVQVVNVPPGISVSMSEKDSQRFLKLRVSPVYPERAKAAHLEDIVVLSATINPAGSVTAVRLQSGNPLLAAAASEAAKQWRYEPFLYQCKPVPVSTQITIEFKLPSH